MVASGLEIIGRGQVAAHQSADGPVHADQSHGLCLLCGPRHGRRQRSPPAVSYQAALLQTEEVIAADDEVIEYVDAEDFAGLY